MAIFQSLYEVGQVFAQHINDNLPSSLAGSSGLVGPPLENAAGTNRELRYTVMWSTPQPTHRNDPWEIGESGGVEPPPLTLSVFVLVTTYGSTTRSEPIEALELLGEVMRTVHSEPVIPLPLASLTGVGEGELSFVQVPTAADLMEKIYSPLNMRHRPWALFEVGPVQLGHRADNGQAPFRVRPGGLQMDGPSAQARPQILRITPQTVIQGRSVRVDVALNDRLLDTVRFGTDAFSASIHATDLGGQAAYLVSVDAAIRPGEQSLSLQVGSAVDPPALRTDPASLTVVAPPATTTEQPVLDPFGVLTHPRTGAISLRGSGLTDVDQVLVWPDAGVAAPSEVIPVAFTHPPPPDDDVRIELAAGSLAGFSAGVYRFAARAPVAGRNTWTPYVILE
ncbi:MAG: Pvc16 family protein, partial [Myxococcota bacterium]